MTHLSPSRRAQWDSLGFVRLPGVLDPATVEDLSRWVVEVESWATSGGPGMHHFEQTDAGPRIARSEDFDGRHVGLTSFLRGRILGDLLAELFGEPAILFKEKINYKYPGGGGFAPHQDAPAYRFVDHHVSCMVPIDPATERSGCLWFAPGHREGLLPNDAGRLRAQWVAAAKWQPVEAAPGDLVFFDSYAPHKSDTNRSGAPRRLMYLTYNAASAGDFRARYYQDKRAELAAAGGAGASGHVLMSINDDFLGRPVEAPAIGPPSGRTPAARNQPT